MDSLSRDLYVSRFVRGPFKSSPPGPFWVSPTLVAYLVFNPIEAGFLDGDGCSPYLSSSLLQLVWTPPLTAAAAHYQLPHRDALMQASSHLSTNLCTHRIQTLKINTCAHSPRVQNREYTLTSLTWLPGSTEEVVCWTVVSYVLY